MRAIVLVLVTTILIGLMTAEDFEMEIAKVIRSQIIANSTREERR